MSAHEVFTDSLRAISGDLGELYDQADELREGDEVDECALAKDWRQQQDDEREMRLEEALNECKARGVSTESLKVLAFETGALHWSLANSLKG